MRLQSISILLLVATTLSGQTTRQATPPPPPAPRTTAEVRLNSLYFDNFFQAPSGAPKENVVAAGVEARISRDTPLRFGGRPVQGYAYFDYLRFDQEEFGGSPGLRFGARSDARPHSWDTSVQLQKDRPSFDVVDETDRADIARFMADYSYRPVRDWQFNAGLDADRQSFDLAQGRDNRFLGASAGVRYRGFGSEFSPEIGLAFGDRSVDDAAQSYGQVDWILQIRSAPTPPLYISARYRHRLRDYDTGTASSSNFGREDTRDQIVLAADLRAAVRLTWNFYLAWENSDSTAPGRGFKTLLGAFGLTYRLIP